MGHLSQGGPIWPDIAEVLFAGATPVRCPGAMEYSAEQGAPDELDFVRQLSEHGRARVGARPSFAELNPDVARAIQDLDRSVRLEMPGVAPALSTGAAFWGMRILHNACRFLVYREIEPQEIIETLSEPLAEPLSASTVYSVDLFLRFLPDVERLARGLGQDDPLVGRLRAIAGQWPLSSVGMSGVAVDASRVQA